MTRSLQIYVIKDMDTATSMTKTISRDCKMLEKMKPISKSGLTNATIAWVVLDWVHQEGANFNSKTDTFSTFQLSANPW